MLVKVIDDKEQFFERSAAALGVFGTKQWLSVYDHNLSLVGIYKDDNQLIGGFFYYKTKRFGFDFIKLPPYTPHCGLFFTSESTNKSAHNSFSKEVMTEVCNYFLKKRSALTILAFPSVMLDLQPFIWNKFKVVPNYTYQIKLDQSIESIKNHYDSKNRNAINKSIKEEVMVAPDILDKNELFHFFEKSLLEAGANVYTKELKNIFLQFSNPQNSFHFVAKKNNQLQGVVFCIYDASTCYYLLGGINKESKTQGVTNLLIQYSIEKAKELGCQLFDFEGSMIKGVEKFFRGFGPELIPYYTINKGKILLEVALKFKKRELF